jgi:transposase
MIKQGKNKYYNRSHISEKNFRALIRCFVRDFNALEASKVTGISHRTCKAIYAKLRVHITKLCIDERADSGAFELDGSCFGSSIRGKRGRGAAVKTPVFSLLKRNGRGRVSIV